MFVGMDNAFYLITTINRKEQKPQSRCKVCLSSVNKLTCVDVRGPDIVFINVSLIVWGIPKATMLGLPPAHPALLAFVAFVLRLIVSIEHSAIYVIFDNQSTIESDAIARALHSQQQTYKTIRNLGPAQSLIQQLLKPKIFQAGALVISMVDEGQILKMISNRSDIHYVTSVKNYMNTKFVCLTMNDSESVKNREEKHLNLFHVVLQNDGGLDFLLWPLHRVGQHNNIELKRFSTEAALFGSIEWQQFSNRVDRRSLQGIQV